MSLNTLGQPPHRPPDRSAMLLSTPFLYAADRFRNQRERSERTRLKPTLARLARELTKLAMRGWKTDFGTSENVAA